MSEEISRELTGIDILSADDLVTEKVDIPEWKGFVFVRSLNGLERDAWEASMIDRTPKRGTRGKQESEMKLDNIRASLVARCTVSSSNVRLFTDAQARELGKKSASALNRLYEVAARLSGLRDEDVEELAADFSEETTELSTSD